MLKKRTVIIYSAIFATLALGVAALSIYNYRQNLYRISYERDAYEILMKGAAKVKDIFHQAPKHFACGDLAKLTDTSTVYLKDNPDYLNCFLSRGKILVKHNNLDFYVVAKRRTSGLYYDIVTRSIDDRPMIPNYGVLFTLSILKEPTGITLDFILEPSELEVYLPERVYAYGPFKDKDDYRFDTIGRHYFIDKFQVTYRDIAEWVYFEKDKTNVADVDFPKSKLEQVKPATNLNRRQMEAFCAFRGKQLLSAELFDAATFYPYDAEEINPLKIVRGPYHWTYARSKIEDFDLSQCAQIFSANCNNQAPYVFFDNRSPSWIGLIGALGGPLEYLKNNLHPRLNVRASSFYFDWNSSWHQLGLRAHWDELGHGFQNFDFQNDLPRSEYPRMKVGFRCMREVSND